MSKTFTTIAYFVVKVFFIGEEYMEKLYKGIHKFQESYFKKEENFFKRISKGQTPDVLFITCSDSRVDPNLVTQSKPGELFIVRNVGNIIPPYDAIKDKNSVAAAIEFAVLALKVKDIIVCGHSNCGAMQAIFKDEKEFDNMPHLRDWLRLALPVKKMIEKYCPNAHGESRQRIAEEENILAQLQNIQTYPFVVQALKKGKIYLHGWYYNIETGRICAYNPKKDMFEEIVYGKNS
ncbi:MAG: carbonic anhydrase [Thermodesulfovibrionales bacterium]|jgi:carbonic anhydrase|nr:carbonic anhydrase [Thermodesulfovibrionales bacterium]